MGLQGVRTQKLPTRIREEPDVILALKRCTFTNDQIGPGTGDGQGGALFVSTSSTSPNRSITISNCSFTSDTASALAVLGSTNTAVIASVFRNNASATAEGGAIYHNGHGLTVSSSTFDGNTGGAIYSISSGGTIGVPFIAETASIDNSAFTNNTIGSPSQTGNGGAIYIDGILKLTNSVLKGNKVLCRKPITT
jgi:hypothetical protein